MCRLGCLPTMYRVASSEKMPAEFGVCKLCDSGEIENIDHLLLTCPAHEPHRAKMLTAVEHAVSYTHLTLPTILLV